MTNLGYPTHSAHESLRAQQLRARQHKPAPQPTDEQHLYLVFRSQGAVVLPLHLTAHDNVFVSLERAFNFAILAGLQGDRVRMAQLTCRCGQCAEHLASRLASLSDPPPIARKAGCHLDTY